MSERLYILRLISILFLNIAFFVGFCLCIIFFVKSTNGKIIFGILCLLISIFIIFATSYHFFKTKLQREDIHHTFNAFVDETMTFTGVGVVMYDKNGDIFWVSKYIEEKIIKNLIGKKISQISEEFKNNLLEGRTHFRLPMNDLILDCHVYQKEKLIVIKDITDNDRLMTQYIDEKPVFGRIEIDNFQYLESSLPKETLLTIESKVVQVLDSLVKKYNIAYCQFINGQFLILTNQKALNRLIANGFDFLKEIRSVSYDGNSFLSLSIGFGSGITNRNELLNLAVNSLNQSKIRGGDQVTIMEYNSKTMYFGSNREIKISNSRTKLRQVARMLESKILSPKTEQVIIYGHIDADLDAVGAALGIWNLVVGLGKKAFIQNLTFDSTATAIIKSLPNEISDVFISRSVAQKNVNEENTVVVLVDTADIERIENSNAFDKVDSQSIFVLDHHLITRLPKLVPNQNMYIDTTISSTSEIVTELLQLTEKVVKIKPIVAQVLLNGIYLDTKTLTQSVGSRTFVAASLLENFGASVEKAVEVLKIPESYLSLITKLVSLVREIAPGYFLTSYDGYVPMDVVSIVADEILRIQGRKAAFVVAKVPNSKKYKLSARGINTNVQIIAEAVGGGGNFSSAAAVSSEPLSVFVDNINQAITTSRFGHLVSNVDEKIKK